MRGTLPTAVALLLGSLHGSAALAAADSPTISQLKQLNVEDLMNIEVTSVTRNPERLLDAGAAIQVITQAQIRRSGATTLGEALRLAQNLQVAQRGSRGWAISARGFNTELANKLLVMIDGRTVYTPLFSGVYWEAQDYLLEDIERIEVVSGPGGTLWGANAVNGVINIITRKAQDAQGLFAQAGAGHELDAIVGLRYGGAFSDDTHYRVYGKHLGRDDSVLADGSAAGDSWHRSQAGFRIDSGDGSGDTFTVQGDFYSNRQRVSTGGTTIMRGANLLGRWSRRISSDSDLSLHAYYDWAHLSDPVLPLVLDGTQFAPAGTVRDDLHTVDLDFQHRFRAAGMHEITWGLGLRYMYDAVVNAPALAFFPATVNQQLYSAFLQDRIRLRDTLSLTVGSKIEHNDYTGLEVEPGIRMQWQPDASQILWAAISRAIRAPSRIDRDLSQAAPPYIVVLQGGPDFRSEEVVAYELGYRAQFSPALTISLAGFYNVYDHVRTTTITPDTILPLYFANDLAGHTHGLEFTGNLQLTGNWSVHLGYNFLQADLRVKPGRIDISNGLNETADPRHQASLRSSLSLPGRVELDAGLRFVDTLRNNEGPERGTVPAYIELEARLAWQATDQLELSIVGQNLLHARHPEYGFPRPSRTEAQRSIFAKLAWRR